MTHQTNSNLTEDREIYQLLIKNEGWAYVTKNNVESLINFALTEKNEKLVRDLKNWY
jgi:hypothetical protein